jgi:hypothetical protein
MRPTVGSAKDVDVNERIDALIESLSERFGDRALDVVIRQFDAAEGDVQRVWGRIMEGLILLQEKRARPKA